MSNATLSVPRFDADDRGDETRPASTRFLPERSRGTVADRAHATNASEVPAR